MTEAEHRVTGNSLLMAAIRRLTEAGVPQPALDARRLLSHAVGIDAGRLTLILPDPVEPAARAAFEALIARRARREPVSHLTGTRAFYGRAFLVSADVLDPRPETELLIEAALAQPFGHVLDLGTGSGCILLTLMAEVPDARGVGVDISPQAIQMARANARALDLCGQARFMVSDWTAEVEGAFDLIVANPPYIASAQMAALAPEVREWEPRQALTDEGDGLAAYRAIFRSIGPYLVEGGRIIVEIGPDQADAVAELAGRQGFETVAILRDLDGRNRVIVAQWLDIPF